MAEPKHDPKSALVGEVKRLGSLGFSLIPVGGKDGKKPLVSFADRKSIPIELVIMKIMEGAASGYGIRLPELVVVDIDSSDPDLVDAMERRFGPTQIKVRTPSGGCHLYYRAQRQITVNLRSEALPIDVKSGKNSYVVGPYSERPGGKIYAPMGPALTWSVLPQITVPAENAGNCELRSVPAVPLRPPHVPKGQRHHFLLSAAADLVRAVGSEAELIVQLKRTRDEMCDDPASVPDTQAIGIAEWWWNLRLENRLYGGRNSAFRVCRSWLGRLQGDPDAIALHVVLTGEHGHLPGKTFVLDRNAMVDAKLIRLSRRRFNGARNTLIDAGLLEVAQKHKAGAWKRLYRLRRPA